MITLHRITAPALNAAFITATLLYTMHLLIDMKEPPLVAKSKPLNIKWVHIPPDRAPIIEIPKPKPLPEVTEAPKLIVDEPIIDPIDLNPNEIIGTYKHTPDISDTTDIYGSQLVLAIGFPPEYPINAIHRNIEGYADVGFSVSKSGTVVNPYIIKSEPGSTFDRAALKSLQKFKYKPQHVNGQPVETHNLSYRFTFELEK